MKIIKNNLGFLFLAFIFIISIYFSITVSITSSEDKVVYLSSDVYREMSIARNLAVYGVWDETKSEISPSS
jgi:hypothetical protein